MGLNIIPHDTKINFIGKKNTFFSLIGLFLIVCFGSIIYQGFNLGIDFKGGLLLEIRTQQPADIAHLRNELSGLVEGDVTLQEFGSSKDVLIRVEKQSGGEEAQIVALNKIKGKLGESVEYRRIETVGPKVSEDLVWNGIWAVGLSLFAMLGYIWFRFEWQFGVCALITLINDTLILLGSFSLFRFEFNEAAIVAVLITITYSINDTVVIYDRIRENLRKFKKMPLPELINRSLNETLSRTLLTSITTLLALFGLYFFGGPVIASFSLPIIIGIGAGTISSIIVSAPLLLTMHLRPNLDGPPSEEAKS